MKCMILYAAVGVQFNESILSRMPGSDRNSLGLHHDSGLLHSDGSQGTPFFNYGPGDTLTVAINFVTDSIVLFKNGLSRGAALVGLPTGGSMYPVVGFDHAEASIAINLGHKPFRYAVRTTGHSEVSDPCTATCIVHYSDFSVAHHSTYLC